MSFHFTSVAYYLILLKCPPDFLYTIDYWLCFQFPLPISINKLVNYIVLNATPRTQADTIYNTCRVILELYQISSVHLVFSNLYKLKPSIKNNAQYLLNIAIYNFLEKSVYWAAFCAIHFLIEWAQQQWALSFTCCL